MLDSDGYRPNVCIILLNYRCQVFWGKRYKTNCWQFPQGGIKEGETPEQAMYRELFEEIGLFPQHVKILGKTKDWLRYNVPEKFVKQSARGVYKGQKQIWFLLQLISDDSNLNLMSTDHPEFDDWRWNFYWVPLHKVIEFKRNVYINGLRELSTFVSNIPYEDEKFKRNVLNCNKSSKLKTKYNLGKSLNRI